MPEKNKSILPVVSFEKEILKVGIFNKTINVTADDLDEMIENFNELKATKDVFFRVGHSSDDTANTKTLRAGLIEFLVRKGDVLVAKGQNMPKVIKELLDKGALKNVSVEFYKKWKDETGKIRRNVLDTVAIMGVTNPAVAGLADFGISFEDKSNNEFELTRIEFEKEVKKNIENKEEDEKLGNEKLELELKELKVTEVANEAKKVKIQEKNDKLELKLQELKDNSDEKEIISFVEKVTQKDNFKLLPAEKDSVVRMLKALDNNKISFEEKGEKLNVRQEFEKFISGLPQRIEFEEKSDKPKVDKEKTEFKSEEEKRNFIADKAIEFAKENKISITEAQDQLLEKYK